jgi:uncharacterized protein (DUF1778 family)
VAPTNGRESTLTARHSFRDRVWQCSVRLCYRAFCRREGTQTAMRRVKETSNRRAARLDVRLAQRAKEKIEEAALVSHQTLTDFVVTTLLRTSDEALKHHQAIGLTNRDRDLFLAALDADERPNPALRKAAQRFKRNFA